VFPLTAAGVVVVTVLVTGYGLGGVKGMLLGVPLAVAGVLVLVWPLLRQREQEVELHEEGLVIVAGGEARTVLFDDVDEVWFELDRMGSPLGAVALIPGLQLVEHGGQRVRVPGRVEDAVTLFRAITRRCSDALLPDARKALSAGQVLTFGKVRLDAEGIDCRGRTRWQDLSLVRQQPGRLAFFRGQTVIPWRTVKLDQVAHPTLFVALVGGCARKLEVDNGWLDLFSEES
jgi:hypothetical protein